MEDRLAKRLAKGMHTLQKNTKQMMKTKQRKTLKLLHWLGTVMPYCGGTGLDPKQQSTAEECGRKKETTCS